MLRDESLHEHEALAYVDEKEFSRRFALKWPRRERGWLLDFQREMGGLSDADIRWLARSGTLKVGSSGVRLAAPRYLTVYGWYCIVALWICVGVPLLHGVSHATEAWRAAVVFSVGMLLLIAATRFLWLFHILPGRLSAMQQVVRHQSETGA